MSGLQSPSTTDGVGATAQAAGQVGAPRRAGKDNDSKGIAPEAAPDIPRASLDPNRSSTALKPSPGRLPLSPSLFFLLLHVHISFRGLSQAAEDLRPSPGTKDCGGPAASVRAERGPAHPRLPCRADAGSPGRSQPPRGARRAPRRGQRHARGRADRALAAGDEPRAQPPPRPARRSDPRAHPTRHGAHSPRRGARAGNPRGARRHRSRAPRPPGLRRGNLDAQLHDRRDRSWRAGDLAAAARADRGRRAADRSPGAAAAPRHDRGRARGRRRRSRVRRAQRG